jgi:hypothetical protein
MGLEVKEQIRRLYRDAAVTEPASIARHTNVAIAVFGGPSILFTSNPT